MRYSKFIVAIVSVALLSLSAVGCKSTFGNQYNTDKEIKLGKEASEEVEKENHLDTDPADIARIQRIATPVLEQARQMRGDVTYQVKIIDSKDVNAFSLPGGWIYIYTGLIKKAGTDDDAIACVIGHEAAHVVLRHSVKQLSDAQSKGMLVDILGIMTRSDLAYQGASLVYSLDQLHYGREDEYQADKFGLKFAYNAGFDPYGMPRFFDVLQKDQKAGDNSAPWANDHPITRNRILRVNDLISQLRANHGAYPDDQQATKK